MNRRTNRTTKKTAKQWLALLVVAVLMVFTVGLLFFCFGTGGWWLLAVVVWLPIFYGLCAALGHEVTGSNGHIDAGPFFID